MTAKISALQFIFFMTLSVQANSQPDLCSYGAKDSSQSTILNSCQLFQQTNCEKIKSDPELRPFLKTCDDVFQTQHSLDQLINQCLSQILQPAADSAKFVYKALLASSHSLILTAKNNIANRNLQIQTCKEYPEFKESLIQEVPLFKGWSRVNLSSLSCELIVVELESYIYSNKQSAASLNSLGKPKLPIRSQIVDLNDSHFYEDFYQNRKNEVQCLNSAGLTQLWCYRVFSVLDPTMALLFVAKAPSLIRAFASVAKTFSKIPKPPVVTIRTGLSDLGLFEVGNAQDSAIPIINIFKKNSGMSGMVRNHITKAKPFMIGDQEFVVQFKAVSDANNGAVNIIYVQNTKTGQVVYTALPPGHETANAFAIQQAQNMLKTGIVSP